ncbi:hypothetical protein BY458DRAFT_574014 [Sporodiniella umbellata]|nr:hypothetical protein BY458DRAFT_574014 [Sporodiniella umbellata]
MSDRSYKSPTSGIDSYSTSSYASKTKPCLESPDTQKSIIELIREEIDAIKISSPDSHIQSRNLKRDKIMCASNQKRLVDMTIKQIREQIDDMKKAGDQWNLDCVASSSVNIEFTNRLAKRLMDIRNNNSMSPENANYERWALSTRLSNTFNDLRRKRDGRPFKERPTTANGRRERNNIKKRRIRCLRRRCIGYDKFTANELQEYEGGKQLLQLEYISEEELDPENTDALVTLRPSWRTEKANSFMDIVENKGRLMKKRRKTRYLGSAQIKLTEMQKASLPGWAFQ